MMGLFASDSSRALRALDKSMAIIEFDLSGTILKANHNFCDLMGYKPADIVGQHHRMFVESDHAQSREYEEFWGTLRSGQFICREFKRIAQGGREVFIRGSYNPIHDERGKVVKIVKFANDITATITAALETQAKMNAISRAQASIEFTVDGTILTANENFLSALGYGLQEIVGQHHRMFVDPSEANSPAYAQFWAKLKSGSFVANEFKRIGKGRKEVYIQASYNPVLDMNGKVVKVVKFATDVTDRVHAVNTVSQALHALSEGDLEQRIEKAFITSLDSLRIDFNRSLDKLQEAMQSVGQNASVIAQGSHQIRSAADDLAHRTEQQAAALEETSGALSEITSTVKQSSQRASEAGQLVTKTKAGVERSGEIVERAVAAMGVISRSSDEIGKIISVIDEIAFQTNLLALNAGVEAARAGEAGRGFAVVAQEVRSLAQRAAEAAKEIKELISTSHREVGTGVELVNEAGEALQVVVTEILEINENVQSIVESARSQAVGLSEINIAVGTLNNATQQNAAMVEESTAASNELAAEASKLSSLLTTFKMGGHARRLGSPAHDLHMRVSAAFG